jgi:molybdopterin biosynthesis enzyme
MQDAVDKDPGRRAYLRVTVDAGLGARSAGGQGSAQVRPLATTDALLVVPEGVRATIPGERYEAILIGEGGSG